MADFNPFDPRLRTNPYAVYKELREEAPVFWSPVMQLWLLSRYDDCLAVLRDHARFSSERTRATNPFVQQLEAFRQASGPIGRAPTMLSLDPPAHTPPAGPPPDARPRQQGVHAPRRRAQPAPHSPDRRVAPRRPARPCAARRRRRPGDPAAGHR